MLNEIVQALGLGVTLTLTGLVGVLAGKVLETLYKELVVSRRNKANFEMALDPVIKAIDELAGKLSDLTKRDFLNHKSIHLKRPQSNDLRDTPDFATILFLYAGFWAQIEKLRSDGVHAEFMRYEKGRQLQNFITALESRDIRLVSRLQQRAIGETLLEKSDGRSRLKTYIEFAESYHLSTDTRSWLEPLVTHIESTNFKSGRQRHAVYGILTCALLDTIDPKHVISKARPPQVNKLTARSKAILRKKIFRIYLKGIRCNHRYWQIVRKSQR